MDSPVKWGIFFSTLAGAIGIILIITARHLFLHRDTDNPSSSGAVSNGNEIPPLPQISCQPRPPISLSILLSLFFSLSVFAASGLQRSVSHCRCFRIKATAGLCFVLFILISFFFRFLGVTFDAAARSPAQRWFCRTLPQHILAAEFGSGRK